MSAIDESLWCCIDAAATRYIRRYNIALGLWTAVAAITPWDTDYEVCIAWNGAYHIYFNFWEAGGGSPTYNRKRINIYNVSLSDWEDQPLLDTQNCWMAQDYGSRLYMMRSNNPYILVFNYTTKVWAALDNPGFQPTSGAGIVVVPPWATNEPGSLFCNRGASVDLQMFDYATGWEVKQDQLGVSSSGYGGLVWADGSGTEYLYFPRSSTNFDKYNVNTNTWSRIGDMPAGSSTSPKWGNNLVWDGDNYLFYLSTATSQIYRFDLTTEVWDSYLEWPEESGVATAAGIAYTPRIRFMFMDSSQTILSAPIALGSVPKDRESIPVKYYLYPLESDAGAVSVAFVVDGRTDAEDILELAADSGGVPGAWGASVNFGAVTGGVPEAFWIRSNPSPPTTQEAKVARLEIAIS